MTEELITFKTAYLAKEKGFGEHVNSFYNVCEPHLLVTCGAANWNFKRWDDGICSAPTQSLLQKWLRDVHHINSRVASNSRTCHFPMNGILEKHGEQMKGPSILVIYKTYEEALEEGLYEALKLI